MYFLFVFFNSTNYTDCLSTIYLVFSSDADNSLICCLYHSSNCCCDNSLPNSTLPVTINSNIHFVTWTRNLGLIHWAISIATWGCTYVHLFDPKPLLFSIASKVGFSRLWYFSNSSTNFLVPGNHLYSFKSRLLV